MHAILLSCSFQSIQVQQIITIESLTVPSFHIQLDNFQIWYLVLPLFYILVEYLVPFALLSRNTKSPTLDVATVLDPPLQTVQKQTM